MKKLVFAISCVLLGQMLSADVTELDPHLKLSQEAIDGLAVHHPAESPLELNGFAWFSQDHLYRRLPLRPKQQLPPGVDELAWRTAGGCVRFKTDSGNLSVRVKLKKNGRMYNMADIGSSGFDLYCGDPGAMRFLKTARFPGGATEYTAPLMKRYPRKMREFILYFPLYAAVESLEIGLDPDAQIAAPTPWSDPRPVIAYGTSILQGGCASRPGVSHLNILSRKLNRPILNFGFSGWGRGDREVAELLASIPNPAMFLIDYEPNCESAVEMKKTLSPFLDVLREKHPDISILVISKTRYAGESVDDGWIRPDYLLQVRDVQRDEVARRQALGDRNIYFLDGGSLFGEDWDECTVDGCHPNDYGFWQMARNLEPVLRRILEAPQATGSSRVTEPSSLPLPAWPKSITAKIGKLEVRFDARSFWSLYGVVFDGVRIGVDSPGSHYGNVANLKGRGLIGSGHRDKGEENPELRELMLDGAPVLQVPELLAGKTLEMRKKTRIGNLALEMTTIIRDGEIRERAVAEAVGGDVRLNYLYLFMMPWTTDFSDFAVLDVNGVQQGVFDGKREFKIAQKAEFTTVYDRKNEIGVITRVIAPSNAPNKEQYWDVPDRYRKHYTEVFANTTLTPGIRYEFEAVSIPFRATPSEWLKSALTVKRRMLELVR